EYARDLVLHNGNDRAAEGRLLQPPAARAAYSRHNRRDGERDPCELHRTRRLYADHAHVPRPRLGLPLRRDAARREAGLSGTLRAGRAARADSARARDVLALRADDLADD